MHGNDRTSRWRLVVTLLAFVGLTGAIGATIVWNVNHRSERQSMQTAAVGLTATATTWDEQDRDGRTTIVHGYTLTYAYSVQGELFPETVEQVRWYRPREHYKICYNPSDPSDSELYPTRHHCGT